MKDIFVCLLLNLIKHGNITEANMYKGGKYASFQVVREDGVYNINIGKEEKEDEN